MVKTEFPLREAFPFLIAHGLGHQAGTIRASKVRFGSYGSSSVRRARVVALLKRKDLLSEFNSRYWSDSSNHTRKQMIERYLKLYDHVKTSNILTGIAGVHYVVSELSLRGCIACPTIRNTEFYDILAMTRDGRKHANIQVKASVNPKAKYWPMPPSKRIRTGPDDYYVFLRWIKKDDRWKGYLVSGYDVRREIKKREAVLQPRIDKGTRQPLGMVGFHVDLGNERKARRWEKLWTEWRIN